MDPAAYGEARCWQTGPVLIEHRGAVPQVDPSAYVAPTAAVCSAVRIGPGVRILFGAVLTAEDGQVSVGARTVVMENAVIRGRAGIPRSSAMTSWSARTLMSTAHESATAVSWPPERRGSRDAWPGRAARSGSTA